MKYLFHDACADPARPMLIPVQPALASTAWVRLMSIATAQSHAIVTSKALQGLKHSAISINRRNQSGLDGVDEF